MNLKSASSFIYSSMIMILLVPGTLERIIRFFHAPYSPIMTRLMMLCLFFMTILIIVINKKKSVKLQYVVIGMLLLISILEMSKISSQPISWRISGYILLIILVILLIFKRNFDMISENAVFYAVILFALGNAIIGLIQYFTGYTIVANSNMLDGSTIRLNADMWLFGHTGSLRAFGLFSSGMAFGAVMVLAFSVVLTESIGLSNRMRRFLLIFFSIAVMASLTKNIYVLYIMVIILNHSSRGVKKMIFFIGVILQFLTGIFALMIQSSPYFQSSFFGTFKIRYTGLTYFQNYYDNTWFTSLFGNGFQYDGSYKNFTALALDNQMWALFYEGGLVLIFIVYFLLYKVAFKYDNSHTTLINILVAFGIFGISNNFLTFFLGVAVLVVLLGNNSKLRSTRGELDVK